MLRYDFSNRRFNQGRAQTRQNRRGTAKDLFINHLRLREISNLRWSSDVGRRGQNEILKDGAQKSIRAETLRFCLKYFQQLACTVCLLASGPVFAFATQRKPRARFSVNQK